MGSVSRFAKIIPAITTVAQNTKTALMASVSKFSLNFMRPSFARSPTSIPLPKDNANFEHIHSGLSNYKSSEQTEMSDKTTLPNVSTGLKDKISSLMGNFGLSVPNKKSNADLNSSSLTDIDKLQSNDSTFVKEAVNEFFNHKLNDFVDTGKVRGLEKRILGDKLQQAMKTDNLDRKTSEKLSFAVAFIQQLSESYNKLDGVDGELTLLQTMKPPLNLYTVEILLKPLDDGDTLSVVEKARLSVFRAELETQDFDNQLDAAQKTGLISQINDLLGDRPSPGISPSEDKQTLSKPTETPPHNSPINFDTNAPTQDAGSGAESKSSLNFKK